MEPATKIDNVEGAIDSEEGDKAIIVVETIKQNTTANKGDRGVWVKSHRTSFGVSASKSRYSKGGIYCTQHHGCFGVCWS